MTNRPTGPCPVCKGTKRVAADERDAKWNRSYDPETKTKYCQNCCKKGMFADPTPLGIVPLNKDGEPCAHHYLEKKLGNCWYQYKCEHCDDSFTIDSGD